MKFILYEKDKTVQKWHGNDPLQMRIPDGVQSISCIEIDDEHDEAVAMEMPPEETDTERLECDTYEE